MPIHVPGEKFRNHRILSKKGNKRSVTAILSLTAMVDMFTVLVIFLLQNYNSTGEIIFIPKEVELPKAAKTKELKPSVVVTISNKEILLDKTRVATYDQVNEQTDWMIGSLYQQVKTALDSEKKKFEGTLAAQIKKAVDVPGAQAEPISWNKVTVQADKGIDFLTIKKVMFTITEAGAGEINFAVLKTGN